MTHAYTCICGFELEIRQHLQLYPNPRLDSRDVLVYQHLDLFVSM